MSSTATQGYKIARCGHGATTSVVTRTKLASSTCSTFHCLGCRIRTCFAFTNLGCSTSLVRIRTGRYILTSTCSCGRSISSCSTWSTFGISSNCILPCRTRCITCLCRSRDISIWRGKAFGISGIMTVLPCRALLTASEPCITICGSWTSIIASSSTVYYTRISSRLQHLDLQISKCIIFQVTSSFMCSTHTNSSRGSTIVIPGIKRVMSIVVITTNITHLARAPVTCQSVHLTLQTDPIYRPRTFAPSFIGSKIISFDMNILGRIRCSTHFQFFGLGTTFETSVAWHLPGIPCKTA